MSYGKHGVIEAVEWGGELRMKSNSEHALRHMEDERTLRKENYSLVAWCC